MLVCVRVCVRVCECAAPPTPPTPTPIHPHLFTHQSITHNNTSPEFASCEAPEEPYTTGAGAGGLEALQLLDPAEVREKRRVKVCGWVG